MNFEGRPCPLELIHLKLKTRFAQVKFLRNCLIHDGQRRLRIKGSRQSPSKKVTKITLQIMKIQRLDKEYRNNNNVPYRKRRPILTPTNPSALPDYNQLK